MNESILLKNIMIENNLNQQQLADILDVPKQSISMIVTGKRNISKQIKSKLAELYPDLCSELTKSTNNVNDNNWLVELRKNKGYTQEEFASKLDISQSLYAKLENNKRSITSNILQRIILLTKSNSKYEPVSINYSPEFSIPNSKQPSSSEQFYLDERLFKIDNLFFNTSKCYIVTCENNALFPYFKQGDKVCIDLSKKHFINDNFFAFTYSKQSYIRKIELLPNKVKCISTNCDEDTFYLDNMEVKDAIVLGLIHPNIRL